MKRATIVILIATFILFFSVAQAQIPAISKGTKVILGLKAGANFQDLDSKSTFTNSYRGGIAGGLFFGVTHNKFGVQAEGIIKTVNYSVSDAVLGKNANTDINTIYADVPVLFEFRLLPRLWLQAGPQFSSLLSAKNNSNDVKNDFNTSDFSGVLGLQLVLPAHFIIGARYVLGLADINSHNLSASTLNLGTEAWHNRSYQIYAGWRIL